MHKKTSYIDTLMVIQDCKRIFESQLEVRLDLIKVQSPIFVKVSTGLQDDLTGVEKGVGFKKGGERFEIVHSLAKWKRMSLGKYEIPMHKGIYTDMKAIRKGENVDRIHSLYVEQWDWEKVIDKQDRTIEYLKDIVKNIYKAIRQTSIILKKKYHSIFIDLPKTVFFITSQELEDMYPDKTPIEREQLIGREKRAVFIIGIGGKLKSGMIHDKRSPDYDDWSLNGDLLIYDKVIDETIEISSMGIRVDEDSLKKQLEIDERLDKMQMPFHKQILEKKTPYSIGGGIGQSRILMLLLEKRHIAEVQASYWEEKDEKQFSDIRVL